MSGRELANSLELKKAQCGLNGRDSFDAPLSEMKTYPSVNSLNVNSS